jgi:putative sterol carrier protein
VAEFLSDDWLASLDAAARAAPDLVADPSLVVEVLVHTEDGDRGYQVRFEPDGASVRAAGAPAHVVLVADRDTAWAFHEGTLRAQDAFARGALKVRGRPELLASHGDLLAGLARVFAAVRTETTFSPAR